MMDNRFSNIFSIENRTKYFSHILVFMFIASVIVFGLLIIDNGSQNKAQALTRERAAAPFSGVDLVAKSAIVWDVVNRRDLFSKGPDERLPLASLTKIMTAIVNAESAANNETVEITAEDLSPTGDSKLVVGDKWRASDLRDYTLITSSNDGAFALASLIQKDGFLDKMNETAGRLGLTNTIFFNEHGLDIDGQKSGAYGSARDIALLLEYALKNHPDVIEATRYSSLDFQSAEQSYHAENTNGFVDQIPGLLASKTGYTDLAGGNLVVAFDAGLNRPIIIAVLGSTEDGRFSDVLQLVKASLESIKRE